MQNDKEKRDVLSVSDPVQVLVEAMALFYKPVTGEEQRQNQARALHKLKKIALQLCDENNGLNVRAPRARIVLELSNSKTMSMDDFYPHFYTILQATLQATTRGTQEELRQQGSLERAYKATNVAKAMLQQLDKWRYHASDRIPDLAEVHTRMLKAWPSSGVNTPSQESHEVFSIASFAWKKLYKIGTSERNHGEERRQYEALAVSALKEIRAKCFAGEPLSIKQQWLLVTAITDYDEKAQNENALRVSPFYNAMQQMAIEENKDTKDLRNELYSPKVLTLLLNSETAQSLTEQALQEKMQSRLDRLIAKDANIARTSNGTATLSSSFFTTPTKTISPGASTSSGEDALFSETHWETLCNKYFDAGSSKLNTAMPTEDEIKQIFKLFDAQYHSLPDDADDNKAKSMLLLEKAFIVMSTILAKEKEKAGGFFSLPKNDVARFNDFIAPKENLPPYTFAKYCEFLASPQKGVSYLLEDEDRFIRKHLSCLYNENARRELDKIKRPDGISLRDYVAPTAFNLEPEILEKSAIGLIYPKLNTKGQRLHTELLALESKLKNRTLSRDDISDETLSVYGSLHLCGVQTALVTINGKAQLSLSQRLDKIIRHVMTVAPAASHSSFMTPTKTK